MGDLTGCLILNDIFIKLCPFNSFSSQVNFPSAHQEYYLVHSGYFWRGWFLSDKQIDF